MANLMEQGAEMMAHRRELFDMLVDEDRATAQWEYCMVRTTQDERLPTVFYFRPDETFEMQISQNKEMGDRNATDAFRRALAMLGKAGWELCTDAYFESRFLDQGRRELYFKRRLG